MTTFFVLFFWFFFGIRHATESDHLAAVATLATLLGVFDVNDVPRHRVGTWPYADTGLIRWFCFTEVA